MGAVAHRLASTSAGGLVRRWRREEDIPLWLHQQRVKVRFLNGTVREITRGSDGTFSCQCGRVFGHPGSLHSLAKQCREVHSAEVVGIGLLDEDDASELESGGEGLEQSTDISCRGFGED